MPEYNKYDNWNDFLDTRVDRLLDKEFFIEAFFHFSTTIEFMLQELITKQEEWIAHTIKKSQLSFKGTKKVEELTLGQLIKIFSRYSNDDVLISKLNDLNAFRKKIVHKSLNYS
ncbi:MAG TPA: hypothetical protein PKD85_01530, partial [Saprospiraceae bacterium]|nr:hypothetical protein [Saprospiraceae bacterium]